MITRRHLLRRFPGYLLLSMLFSKCNSANNSTSKIRKKNLAIATSFAYGSTLLPIERLLIIRDHQGFAAMSLVCTHQMCLVRPINNQTQLVQQEFSCPCHGSRFNQTGQVLTGPANRDLPWYKLEYSQARELIVNFEEHVPSSWRLADS